MTRHSIELANHWLEVTRLWLDSTNLWLWLDSTKITREHHCSSVGRPGPRPLGSPPKSGTELHIWINVDTKFYNIESPYIAVLCPSHFCRVRVESESLALRVRVIRNFVESESASSHDLVDASRTNGRVTSSHWLTSSSQCRVKQISNFSYIFFAIGPPVDRQWLQFRQWIFSGYTSTSGPWVATGPPVDLQWP